MNDQVWRPTAGVEVSQLKLVDYLNQLSSNVAICAPDGEILFVNDAWARFSIENGYRGNSFIGQNYFDVCSATDGVEGAQGRAILAALRALALGETNEVEIVYPCHAPHERRWHKLNAAKASSELILQHTPLVIQHSKAPTAPEKFQRDVSADSEARLIHDLKNAVAPIRMSVEFAKNNLRFESKRKIVEEALDRALRAGTRMDVLMEGMLSRAMTVLETATSIDPPIDLEAFIGEHIGILEAGLAKSSFRINSRLKNGVRLAVRSAPLDRIVSNLLSNALKYTHEPREIVISIGLNRSGGIFLVIEDNGIGISKEMLPKIFDQYQRGEDMALSIEGSGVGLTIVKEMVELLDGIIRVESKVSSGSSFKIEFPSWRTV